MKRVAFALLVSLVMFFALDCGHFLVPYHYINNPETAVAPTKVINIWIDKEFSSNDKENMQLGINQWNYALNGYIVLKIVSKDFDMEPSVLNDVVLKGEGWLFLKIDHNSNFIRDKNEKIALAFVNDIGGNRIYFVRERFGSDAVQGITMHEIGHLLGATHSNGYLMQPTYSWENYRCVDWNAVKQAADFQRLPQDRMNFCAYDK